MDRLSPIEQRFILHWGEMGTRWGINRTVAQIHALLYLSARPLNAEEIAETLSVARSNVSTSLRELQNWGIVKIVHVMGDRRDHFESMKDVWEMFRVIVRERKRREIDPTLTVLRECVEEAGKSESLDPATKDRMTGALDFFETMTSWYEQLSRMPTGSIIRFVKMGDKVFKLVGSSSE